MAVAGRGASVKGTVMVEHCGWFGQHGRRTSKDYDGLGPTPVKSRRSMTSACWEPFFERDFGGTRGGVPES